MTVEDFLQRLEAVRRSGRGFVSRCPAHKDRTPSLSVRDGERGVLVKCWAGCRLQDITAAVGLTVRDLFYAQIQDPREWKKAQRKRQAERERREAIRNVLGFALDVRREAEGVLSAALNPGLAGWSDDDLDRVLTIVADAYEVRFAEKVEHGEDPF
jgi:hypothetical protein